MAERSRRASTRPPARLRCRLLEAEARLARRGRRARSPAAGRYGRSPRPRRSCRGAPHRRAACPARRRTESRTAKRSPAPVRSARSSTGVAGTAVTASGVDHERPVARRPSRRRAGSRRRAPRPRYRGRRSRKANAARNRWRRGCRRCRADQVEKLVAEAVDAEGVRQRQRHLAAGLVGDLGGARGTPSSPPADPTGSLRGR